MEDNKASRNKKIGLVVSGMCSILFFTLLFMKEKINDTNLVYLYPVILLIGMFFAFLSSTGKAKGALRQIALILSVFGVITLLWFLLKRG